MTEISDNAGTGATGNPVLRSSRLQWRSNPRSNLDYVVTLDGAVTQSGFRIKLRYVPDKLLIDCVSFAGYLAALVPVDAATPETLALVLLDDINNEIVPRWMQIAVTARDRDDVPGQTVIMEDHQPNWKNAGILANLPPL